MVHNMEGMIRGVYAAEAENIQVPESIKAEIDRRIMEADVVRKGNRLAAGRKKVGLAVAAVLLFSSMVCTATMRREYNIGYINTDDKITDISQLSKIQEETGLYFNTVEKFNSGFQFAGANVSYMQIYDENTQKPGELRKEIILEYAKGDKEVQLSLFKWSTEDNISSNPVEVKEIGGYTAYLSEFTIKCVPTDYALTQEDKEKEETGRFSVSAVESDEITLIEYQNITWLDEDKRYFLTDRGNDVGFAELEAICAEWMAYNSEDK